MRIIILLYGGENGNLCKGGEHLQILQRTQVLWKVGETVKMKVDLINWQITFYKNREQIAKTVRIKERDVYYAAVEIVRGMTLQIID